MSGPKRNEDKLNTLGIVVVGICGAVMVYVTIVALQAYYMNDTSEIQTMADYGGQDTTQKAHKAAELQNVSDMGVKNAAAAVQTYRITIDEAMKDVVRDAKTDPAHLVPGLPKSDKPTIEPEFKRGAKAVGGTPAPADGAGSGAGSGSGSAASAPMTPTGAPGGPAPVAGAGGQPAAGSGSAH